MERATLFDVVEAQRDPAPRIVLARQGTGTRLTLDAAALLAQYRCSTGEVLLVLDEDTPYEEQLHIVLIENGRVADELVVGAPYSSGVFREVDHEGDTLRFRFASDDVMTLTVAPATSRLPQRLPAGVRRRGGWFAPHRLTLTQGVA